MRNSYFSEVAWGAEEAARDAGYYLVLCNTEGRLEMERQYLQSFKRMHAPFVIAAPTSRQSAAVLREFTSTIPTILIDQILDDLDAATITTDNFGGSASATRHLIAFGHRDIACVRGPADTWTTSEREAGYREAMQQADLKPNVIAGGFTRKKGRLSAMEFLAQKTVPTAAVLANDYSAIGFCHELRAQGRGVPEDVSVVGFDDLELAAFGNPPLTTVHQPARKVGRRAVKLRLRMPRPR